MKILRLSIFNIKKRKKEAFIITLLLAISMVMMGIGIINIEKADRMFDDAFEKTESYRNIYMIPKETYKDEFRKVMEDDDRIDSVYIYEMLQNNVSTSISYRKEDGTTSQFYASFIAEDDEKNIEKFERNAFLSDQEIDNMEHPIWLPYYVKFDMGYSVGDNFTFVIGGKDYPFQIAGFYETGLFSGAGGLKCVISEDDFDMMSAVVEEQMGMAFDTKEGVINNQEDQRIFVKELEEKFEEITAKDITLNGYNFYEEKDTSTMVVEIIMAIVAFISVVTAVSGLFVIRHKITNDIDDQMESIGVLEALGYRSIEISGAYIYEYLLLSILGILAGGVLILVTDPLMSKVLQIFIGRNYVTSGNVIFGLIPSVIILVLTLATALGRARRIKKYPPVVAFRKGIKTHHFGRNVFPIEKTKADINRRLGLKSLTSNMGQNVGMFICIFAAAAAITFCVILCDIFRDRGAIFLGFVGIEKALMVGFDEGTDFDQVKQEIEQREDVRKTVLIRANNGFTISGDDTNPFQSYAYDNFDELENLTLSEGRYPIHENEVLVSVGLAEKYGLSIGDSALIKFGGVEKSYIVSGTVNVILGDGRIAYMTLDGYRQFMSPTECANYLFVYPVDGVSDEELKARLTEDYGSVEASVGKSEGEGTYEERIRAKADEQMALLKSKYGVSNVSYAIKVGDKMIYGNSGNFKLTEISSMKESVDTSIGGISVMTEIFSVILMIIMGFVVSIILNFLIDSTIKKERQTMGIEKAMGYTSNDIKKQLVSRMMPVVVPAIILGALMAIPITCAFMTIAFSTVFGIRLFWIPIAIVLITLFVYISTYISAGKVKKVSVTELMTE